MTTASIPASSASSQRTPSAEITAADTGSRGPLLLLICAAAKWLVVSGIFALIASIQLFKPAFLADCSWLTHGRVEAMRESTFLYGWAANAGLAVALWVLARLGGSPLRAGNWVIVGTVFWNLGLLAGLVGIATGDATSISFLELPRYVQPLMLVAYAAMAVAGVLAWTGRRTESTFASQWYAVAALFLFPWIFSIAQVMLLFAPVRGTLQAIVAGWYVQGAWTLWLAPLALSGAYYLVPKITGRPIPSYFFWTSLSFWTLVVVGAWTGGRHLVGGPVPAWIPSVAIVSCSLLVFHYFMVFLNLRGAFGGGGTALKFVSFGLFAYVLGGLADSITAMRAVAKLLQFTHFAVAQEQLALYGAVTMMFFGALYYLVPRVSGRVWASAAFVRGHFFLMAIGVVLLVASLVAAGWIQGHALNDVFLVDGKPVLLNFGQIAARTETPLVVAAAANGILLLGSLVFAVNFWRTAFSRTGAVPAAEVFRPTSTMEVPAL
jgi:cytochrome c oxidase cbb3-type subunit I